MKSTEDKRRKRGVRILAALRAKLRQAEHLAINGKWDITRDRSKGKAIAYRQAIGFVKQLL